MSGARIAESVLWSAGLLAALGCTGSAQQYRELAGTWAGDAHEAQRIDGVVSLRTFACERFALDLRRDFLFVRGSLAAARDVGTALPSGLATGSSRAELLSFAGVAIGRDTFWHEVDSGNRDAVPLAPHATGLLGQPDSLDAVCDSARVPLAGPGLMVRARGGLPTSLAAQVPDSSRHRMAASGDFRIRGEYDVDRTGRTNRARPRIRLRAQGTYELLPSLKFTGRLVTLPNTADPNSTHQDLGQEFRGFPVAVDRAFVEWTPGAPATVRLLAGKFGHPFTTAPVFDELVWDADIQPEGVAAVLGPRHGVRIVAAEYLLLLRNPGTSVGLTAGQLSWSGTLVRGLTGSAGVGGYLYQRPDTGGARLLARENQGNALLTGPTGDTTGFASRFSVVHVFAGLRLDGWRAPVTVSAQYVRNGRAAAGFDDDGVAIGIEAGKLAKPGSWVARYQYMELGRESLYSPVAQDDFLNSTNFRGHLAGGAVQVAPRVDLYFWTLLSASQAPRVGRLQKRIRLDLNLSM